MFKRAKIIPVFKKRNPKNVFTYRPISLLPSLSKILEKVVYNRLHSFINMNDNLSHQQFGFRHKHSTNQATTLLISNIVDAFEKKQSVLGIFLDISKAFDTIDHTILLCKLNNYGVRGVSMRCQLFTLFAVCFFCIFMPTQKHTTERKSKSANAKINDQTQKYTVKRKNK